MSRNVRKLREYSTARNNLILSTSARRNAEANTTNSITSDISCCIIVLFFILFYIVYAELKTIKGQAYSSSNL